MLCYDLLDLYCEDVEGSETDNQHTQPAYLSDRKTCHTSALVK